MNLFCLDCDINICCTFAIFGSYNMSVLYIHCVGCAVVLESFQEAFDKNFYLRLDQFLITFSQ